MIKSCLMAITVKFYKNNLQEGIFLCNIPSVSYGGIAQLEERCNGIAKVKGSNPLTSTK